MSQNNTNGQDGKQMTESISLIDHENYSSSVESLISQNDDLMARLSLSIRKEAKLEQILKEKQHEISAIEKKVESSADQILIYKEKDRLQKQRMEQTSKQVMQLTQEVDVQKVKYAEIFTTSQNKIKSLTDDTNSLTTKLFRLTRFKTFINQKITPIFREQKKEITRLKSSLKDLHYHLGESGEHIKTQQSKIDEITTLHKEELKKFHSMTEDYEFYKKQYLELKEERTAQQNKVIALERLCSDVQSRHHTELQTIQTALSEHRATNKALISENQVYKKQNTTLETYRKDLIKENDQLRDQNESLQILWKENKDDSDSYKEQVNTLQKLNDELLQKISRARKENNSEIMITTDSSAKTLRQSKKTRVNNLEKLLAEIQSGYNYKRSSSNNPSITPSLKEKSFIEDSTNSDIQMPESVQTT